MTFKRIIASAQLDNGTRGIVQVSDWGIGVQAHGVKLIAILECHDAYVTNCKKLLAKYDISSRIADLHAHARQNSIYLQMNFSV